MDFTAYGARQAPSLQSKIVGRAYAEKAAKTIFTRYPNPKAGAEYLVELTNCLAEQSQHVVDRIADRHLGITAKSPTFLPTVGQVVEMINQIREQEARYARYSAVQSRRQATPAPERMAYRPYPTLWAAFAGEPDVLDRLDVAESFDFLTEASRRLAVRGKDAARKYIYPQPVDAR